MKKSLLSFIVLLFASVSAHAQIINAPNLKGPITSHGVNTAIASQTGTGTKFVVDTSPTLITPNLGTPSALVGTNITGTAASFTAGHVSTNANLTGVITSVGNATSIASQTGTGSKFVVDTSPTLVTPILGAATATSINKLAITAPTTSATLTIADGKTATVNNSLTLTGTDGTTITFPTSSATMARTDAANTLTGMQIINQTAATNSTAITSQGSTTGSNIFSLQNTGGTNYFGRDSSTGALSGVAYADFWLTAAGNPFIITGGSVRMPNLTTTSAAQTGTVCWTTGTGNLTVDTTTTCLASARRFKQKIKPLNAGLGEVMKLRPVSYELKPKYNPAHLGRQVGFIAEDVEKIDDRFVAYNDGKIHGIRYQQMIALLTKAIQEQQMQIDELKRKIK